MSVLNDLISSIEDTLHYAIYEGDVEAIQTVSPKYDEFVAVLEQTASFDKNEMFTTQGYMGDYSIIVELVTKKASVSEAWSRARTMRDAIITTVLANTYDGMVVYLDNWSRLEFLQSPLEAGYVIELRYGRVRA